MSPQRKYQFNPHPRGSVVPVLELIPGKEGLIQCVGLYTTRNNRHSDVLYHQFPGRPHITAFFLDSSEINVGRTLEDVNPQHLQLISAALLGQVGETDKLLLIQPITNELTELRQLEIETAAANPRYRDSRF